MTRREALRRLGAAGAAVWLAPAARAAEPAPATQHRAADFDALWLAIDRGDAYLEPSRDRWREARGRWRTRAARAGTRDEFLATLEGLVAELRDDSVLLSERSSRAPRRVPFESDIWARWRGDAATIEAVRAFGDADVAGLHPGAVVLAVNGSDIGEAVRRRVGAAASAAERDWALRHLLAGPRAGIVRLDVRDETGARTLEVERADVRPARHPPLAARRIGDDRDLGYVRLREIQRDRRFLDHLDGTLGELRGTRGLIVDLREAAGAVPRALLAAVLARFAPPGRPWQARVGRDGSHATDLVPEGASAYAGPIVVLVDHWSAGSGEALAAGLRAAAQAELVGTPMAGLHGEPHEARLPHSGLVVRFPGEKTLLVDGKPRETLAPAIAVDLAHPSGGPGDPILYQGLKALEALALRR